MKKVLSIFLALVLVATTFFVFDPGVLRLDAGALSGTGTNTTPQAAAPETVYLKPGENEFQYFSNIDTTNGVAAGSKDASGVVSYSDLSSTETKLYVNNLWHKVGKTGDTYEDFAISNLELGITGGVGSQKSITLAGLSATNAAPASGATVIGSGSDSAEAVLNTSSCLKNATPGDVYMIEWAAVSTIDGTKHVKFMYTGVYAPLLTITGAALNGKHSTTLTNIPKASGFGFITGAMAYAEKGNRTTAYTGTTAGVNCAPLVKFVGQQNNGSDYTIPNCQNGWSSTESFPDAGSPKTIMVVPDVYDANGNGDNYDVWTAYSSWGSYTSPSPTGTNHSDVGANGQTDANVYAGVAYEVVDTSRFTDFSEIPNLSAGFIRYYHDRGGDKAALAWIRCSDAPNADALSNGVGCVGIDSSDHDDNEDSWRSRTYGLYSFGGAVPTSSKGMYVMFRYNEDITVYNYPIQLNIGVGLHVTSVNKDAQRKGYCQYLTSVIDNVSYDSYQSFYGNMKKMACRLCDPTCTDAGTVSGCTASEIKSQDASIINTNNGTLYFYVPETIYLNPVASPDGFSFQYFADRENTPDGNLIATPNKTSGNVFICIPQADYIADVQAVGSGMTAVIGKTSTESGVNTVSTTVTGYSSSYASGVLNWTVSYVDAETDEVNTVTASSYVYAPNVNPDNSVISVTINPGTAKSLSNKDGYLCSTAWITGAHRIISSCYGITSDSDGNWRAGSTDIEGSYLNNFLLNPSYTVPAAAYRSVSVYNTNGTGGSGYWSTDDDVHYPTGGMGEINIDSSRYSNLGQIPNLFTGIDCNGVYESPATVMLDYGWYSDCAGNLYNVNNCAVSSQDIPGGYYGMVNGRRFTGFNSASFVPYMTATKTLIVKQTNNYRTRSGSLGSSSKNVTGEGLCYLKCKFYDKSEIRNIYNLVTGYSNFLQPRFFKSDVRSRFSALHSRIAVVLGQPDLDMSTFNNAELAEYYNLASAMAACKLAEVEEGTTASFTDYSGNTKTVYKSDYILTDSIPADCYELYEAIAEAEELDESIYTLLSWNALQTALDNAYSLPEDLTVDYQMMIDNITAEIIAAINNLCVLEADYTEIDALLDQITDMDSSLYTTGSWNVLMDAVADVVRALAITEQATVDAYAAAIEAAIENLEEIPVLDYSELEAVIAEAEELSLDCYTDETVDELRNALDYAHTVLEAATIQSEVDEAAYALMDAICTLRYKYADYSSVEAAIALIPDDASIYTDESWAALMAAVESIVYDLEINKQVEVDAMAEAIIAAIEALELKTVEEVHVWGSWYMVVNPTLTATGLMRRDCQSCGEYEEMIVPALVPDFVTGITLGSKSIALSMGDRIILYSEVEPETAVNQNLIWESTDPNVVTVNQSGKITAVGVGVANIIVRSAENPNIMDYCMVRVASLIASGNFTVVDNDSGLIYGLSPNLASLEGYVDIVDETTSILIEEESIGTGTEINIVRDDEIVDTYTAVIFGDANGDSWYDGTDSLIVNCLANGLLSKAQVGEAVYTAADCNHDGVIDENDVVLLEQAGLILTGVDQSKTSVELFEDAAFCEYISLIDQSPVTAEETTVDGTPTDVAPVEEPVATKTLIHKIMDFIIYIFKMIISYIPKVF